MTTLEADRRPTPDQLKPSDKANFELLERWTNEVNKAGIFSDGKIEIRLIDSDQEEIELDLLKTEGRPLGRHDGITVYTGLAIYLSNTGNRTEKSNADLIENQNQFDFKIKLEKGAPLNLHIKYKPK